jgi:NAD(P)-dependent dehydrogenase (short-subunit alcohol dehydrogenase family)
MMKNPFSLEGKNILITGASSGIGRQCAISCSQMGATVVLVARNEERLIETLEQMVGEEHIYRIFDLEDIDNISVLIEGIVTNIGKIDGFIHAAGIEKTSPIKLLTPNDYERIFKVNSLSAFEFVHQFSNKKYFNDGGHIVLISSIAAVIGRGGVSAYAASKGAMISAVRSMAIEFAKKRICVNCVSPGTVLTPLMQNFLSTLSEKDYQKRIDGFLLGLGETEDVANACVYLLSDASRWVTGQNLIVDGGYTVK